MKLLNKLIFLFLFIILTLEVLFYPNIIMPEIYNSLILWSTKVVPSLLPFFLLTHFLMNYGLTNILSELFKPIMKLFKTNSNNAFIFIMSILTGSPSNAFFACEAINNCLIDENDATKILMFSQFASPLFILGTVYNSLNNRKLCIIILVVTYITNIILALIFRNYNTNSNYEKVSIKNIKNSLNKNISFGKILSNSIHKTFDTLLIILGSICFFNIVSISLKQLFSLNEIHYAFISGLLEMTQGINNVCLLSIPISLKTILITIFLSFGGFSIHSQVLSITSDTKIKYLPYLVARILHALISGIVVFILLCFIKY